MPVRTSSSWRPESLPTSSVMRSRSRATICEVLATESLGNPVVLAGSSTLPGASTQTRLLVKGTQTTVRRRLRFSASPWTTITGLRNPGPEPVGCGTSAQYTCPWEITIRRLRGCVAPPLLMLSQVSYRPFRKHGSLLQSRPRDRAARYIQSRLPYKPGFVTSSGGERAALHHGKSCRESRLPFSYPEYNRAPGCVQAK